jgi:hypothetical protein
MNQLTGIPKPQSPFRRVDVPTPQQQQQQQQQRRQSSNNPQQFRPQPLAEQPFAPPSNNNWVPPQNPTSDLNIRPGIGLISNRYPSQPVVPPYQPPLYNPTTAAVPQHFTPTPMMSNQQYVHGLLL